MTLISLSKTGRSKIFCDVMRIYKKFGDPL